MSIRTPDRRVMEYFGMAAALTFVAVLLLTPVYRFVAWLFS